MNKLKNISLYKILLFILINLFSQNIVILIISLIYLIYDNKESFIIFVIVFTIINLTNLYDTDYIKYGIVNEKRNNYYLVNKFLYNTKVYNNSLEIGDIVYFDEGSRLDTKDLKYNTRFIYDKEVKVLNNIAIKKIIRKRIDSFDDTVKSYLYKFVLNDNLDNSIADLGYGFSIFIIFSFLKRKIPKLTLLLIILYSLTFKFDVKFYLLIFDILLSFKVYDKFDRLFYKAILILIINYELLTNLSILISLLFNLYYMLNIKKDKSYIFIGESLIFNEINPIRIFLYKYLIIIRIVIYILSVFVIVFKPLSFVYSKLIYGYSLVLKCTSFSIRGRINFIFLFLILLVKYKINKNQYLTIILVLLCALSPINNPFFHVSYLDVGQGDSILIHGPLNSYNVLIDTGSTYNYSKLKKELYKEGIKNIDYLIITHNDTDHSGNVDNLKCDFNINNINYDKHSISIKDLNLNYIDLGNYTDDNDNSLVYYLIYNDFSFLFTGDISSSVENIIYNKYHIKNIDVLKVSHHGSNSATSKYFVSMMLPKIAVISTSGQYNHPSTKVLDALKSFKVDTYITKDDGTIRIFVFDKFKIIKYRDFHFDIIKS